MIRAIAIDDEPLALELIENYCNLSSLVTLQRTFTKVNEAQKYLKNFPIDLLFLDVQMPQKTGLDFYKSLDQDIMVIFSTAHSQYAIDGFNLSAIDYLLKPYSFQRFEDALKKAHLYFNSVHKLNQEDIQYLFVRSDYSLVKIPFNEIIYIESFADYLHIHQANGKKTTVRMTMKSISEKLPETEFIRVHRSYIVSLKWVEKIKKKEIYIQNIKIPMGSLYEEKAMLFFNQ